MSFDSPLLLLLALIPIAWAVWEWRLSSRRHALLLKAGCFVSIALALAGPRLTVYQSKVAVAVLADTSASVSPQDLVTASAIANQVERSRGRHWTRIMPFARNTRFVGRLERDKNGIHLSHTADAPGR